MTHEAPASAVLTDFILEAIETQPIDRRITLYYAFAAETPDKETAMQCRSLAADLERVSRKHRQLRLNFAARKN
jgi:hypothetical protein